MREKLDISLVTLPKDKFPPPPLLTTHHSSLHDLFTAAAGVSEESAALLGEERPSEGASPFPPPPPAPLPMTQGVGRRQPITAVPATHTPNNAATWMIKISVNFGLNKLVLKGNLQNSLFPRMFVKKIFFKIVSSKNVV